VQKIQAGHLAGSVILVGSVGSSVDPVDCSPSFPLLLPSPDENEEESVQLLVRPDKSAGSALMETGGVFLFIRGGDTEVEEDFTRLLPSEGLVMAATDAVLLMASLLSGLISTWPLSWLSPVSVGVDSVVD
jgi:hypothetical protein